MPLHSLSPFDRHDCPDSTCGQSFADLDAFYKHWTQHRGQCPFPACETPTKSKYNFERHCARKHGNHFVEYQRVEMTACKNRCGKVYSKADVSNLRRHEKTCSRKRIQQQSVNGDMLSTTVEGNLYANTSEPLQNLGPQDSASPHRSASLGDRNLHETIDSTRGFQGWHENRPSVEALKPLQRNLAGGPAANALQAFARFLDNLGPSVHISSTSDSSELIRVPSQSDKSDDLSSFQQGDDERSIIFEEAASSHFPPVRHGLVETQQSDGESSDGESSDGEMTDELQPEMVEHAFAVRSIYDCVRYDTLTTTKIIETFMISGDLNYKGLQLPSLPLLNEVSNFCESFAAILASIKLDLNPNIIFLALVIVYELYLFDGLHLKVEHHIVGAALMLAEIFSDDEPHTAVSWAKATGIPEDRVRIMKETINEEMDEHKDGVLDRRKIMEGVSYVLARSSNIHAECQDPSPPSLLMQIMFWASRVGNAWWS